MVVIEHVKAFSVTNGEVNVLVYATDRAEAKTLGHGTDILCDDEWIDLRVKRQPLADQWAHDGGPRVDEDGDHMRDLGWYPLEMGGLDCTLCGLYDWSDGMDEETVVCERCQRCGGCGHEDDCLLALARTLFDHGDPLVFDAGMIADDYAYHWQRHPRA